MSNGVYPPDYTTNTGLVRGLIPDTDTDDGTVGTNYLFSDEYIESFLGLYANDVRLTAAALLDALASDQALLYKSVRTDDLSVNGAVVADSLRKRAASLRAEASQGDESYFDIVYTSEDFIPEGTPSAWGRGWTWAPWR